MSKNLNSFKNPLIRDGVSQRQRQMAALSPDFIKLDEWELADALLWACQLSQKIKYYDLTNREIGHWEEFWHNSAPVQIAQISKMRPQAIKERYAQALQKFLDNRQPQTLQHVLAVWKEIVSAIADWHQTLKSYLPLQDVIRGLVRTNLSEPLTQMQQFERMAGSLDPDFYRDLKQQFDLDLKAAVNYRTTISDRAELDLVFQGLFQTYRQIIQTAPQHLHTSLSDRADHPPHLALFFAFWEVLRPARDDLNRITQRHLDFFYRQVLALRDRPAVPDRAHLLFELAKLPDLKEFNLPQGTRFSGGKDAIGQDLIYTLDQDIVVHKAKIASLKGLFIDPHDQAVYASAIVNSFDGKGADFPKTEAIPAWLPFGDASREPVALGLAIAADVLLLQEGDRTIQLTLTVRDPQGRLLQLQPEQLRQCFQVKVSSTEKAWLDAALTAARSEPRPNATDQFQVALTIQLAASQPPLLPYQAELPGAKLPTTQPVLLLLLNPLVRIDRLAPYYFLRSLQLLDLTLETSVQGVRNLIVQNDLTILDANKPFPPFGSQPQPGSSLYIGSQEVLQKALTALTVKLNLQPPSRWLDIYAAYDAATGETDPNLQSQNFDPGRLTIQALSDRVWSEPIAANLFTELSLTEQLATLKLDRAIAPQPVAPLTTQSQNSFLRLTLATGSPRSDFLHADYPTVLARQMIAVATTGGAPGKRNAVIGAYYQTAEPKIVKAKTAEIDYAEPILPREPYLPMIQSLSLDYRAIARCQDCTLFHLCPFDGFEPLAADATPSLLMQLPDAEGELWIGVQDLDPPTALPLLFQVVEESADTSLKKAELSWFYLNDNRWLSLSDRIVSDTTQGLVASGIVQLGLPSTMSRAQTTILDPKLHWIKAVVPARSRAICRMLNVHPQAAQVTFTDNGNDPNHGAIALTAGAIAALETPQPQIKAVVQPYNAFGGKLKETPAHFYLRVSEHLRHKGRAVTIFDYERLVLEKFPEIYKVRCINHGAWDETQDQMYELVPGTVTLAVIPDLSKRISLSDLEPKVNINLLEQIQDYVASLSSTWADIRVVNPRYEKIRIAAQVKLKSPYDANFGYYSRTLNQAITDFLAPWTRSTNADIQFGGRLYYSAVLDFIEQQDYVDYLVDFNLSLEGQTNVREAIASTPRSVLTSGASMPTTPYHKIQEFRDTMILPSRQLPKRTELGYQTLEDLTIGQSTT